MKKSTWGLFLILFLVVLLIFCLLLYLYKKEKTITFYAVINEISDKSALITPIGDNNPLSGYDNISVPIAGLRKGDIIIITCLDAIMESYPPQISIVSYKIVYDYKETTNQTAVTSTIVSTNVVE